MIFDEKNTNFCKTVLKAISDLTSKVNIVLKQQKYLKHCVDKLCQTLIRPGIKCESFDMSMFPIRTISKLESFEQQLSQNNNMRQSLIRRLTMIGGKNIKFTTINLLKLLLSDDLAKDYSWSAGKGKRMFSSLNLASIILEVTLKNHPGNTEHNVIEIIKNWLRHSKDRFMRSIQEALQASMQGIEEEL